MPSFTMQRTAFLLFVLMMALGAPRAPAQSGTAPDASAAMGHFHRAAQAYIGEDVARAEREVRAGLRLDPSNEKLRALREQLQERRRQRGGGASGNQQNRPQQQGASGAQRQQESAQEQDDASEEQGRERGDASANPPRRDAPPEEEPDASQAEPSQAEPSQAEPSSEENQPSEGRGQEKPSPQQAGEAARSPSDRMARAQALRILQALQDQEEELLRGVLRPPEQPHEVEKDW